MSAPAPARPPAAPDRYAGWHKVASPGIGGLGLAGSAGGVAGLLAAFAAAALASPAAGLAVAAATAAAVLPLAVRGRDGRNGWASLAARAGFRLARSRGRTGYRPGSLPPGTGLGWSGPSPAPGLLARSRLRTVQVPLHGPVGVLRTRADAWTVLLECPVEPAALVDPQVLAGWTEAWGRWLAALPHEDQVRAATVTVETGPDSGAALRAETARLSAPGAPPLAAAFLGEVAGDWAGRAAAARCWVAVVFTTARPGGRPAGQDQMCALIAERLPGLCASLGDGTGAGQARPMTAAQITALVRAAYDPAAAALLDEADAAGIDHGLAWTDAGPAGAQEHWDHLLHDGAASVTWKMTAAPAGGVPAAVLAPLLDPSPGLLRKRVTLCYRHHGAADAARIADADLRTAAVRAGQRRGEVRAEHAAALEEARRTADEVAAGAGLTRLSLLVTATADGPDGLPAARALTEQLAGRARLQVRPCYGDQSAAFTAALGVGVLPADAARTPDWLRDAL